MRPINKLTEAKVSKSKPETTPYKLFDGGGLYLLVTPEGGRYWRLAYRFAGKQKGIGLGVYPAVSLATARAAREAAKAQLASGIDPSAARQASKHNAVLAAANSFEAVAREWWERKHQPEVVPAHAIRSLKRLERHLFPAIGRRPISEISPAELLAALQAVEREGIIETATRLRTLAGQIFRYAIPSGRADRDIAADLRDALQTAKPTHHPAITDPQKLRTLLREINAPRAGSKVVQIALRLAPILFVRPGELRQAQWNEFRLDAAEWDYKPSKGGLPMIYPLPKQAVALLKELQTLSGRSPFLFPSSRNHKKPISDMTISAALNRLGYKGKMTVHGFRATARTLLAERLGYPPEIIEMQLAHAVRDANGRAYNRTTYLQQRRDMMQAWANYLENLSK